jgi:predicted 2-oxoglutarate/Fe(II)-dependent dioxygenase YbiX
MGTLSILAAAAAGAGTVGSIFASTARTQAQNNEIKSEIVQQRLAEAQRSTVRTQQLSNTLSAAAVTEAARGISLASPTFQAIQQQSFSNFQQDQNADALNVMFRTDGLRQQISQNRLANDVDIGTSITNLGHFFANNLDLFRLSKDASDTGNNNT